MKQVPRIICRNSGSSSGETHLFGRDAWREWSGVSRRLQLLGAASNEGPGLLCERLPVAMAFSQFHLGELSQGDKMQLKPDYPLSQERLSCDGQKKLLLIRPPAEVRLIGRVDGFDPTKDTVGKGRSRGRKIPHLSRGRLTNLGQARDAA
jgi:hypothetical protein